MNFDFHYYGTYCAARIAGFSAPEADEIAWAAQMVDDCTKSLLDDCQITGNDRVITCETLGDNAADETAMLSRQDNETLKKIRRIWMPFHFLPGNLPCDSPHQVYTGDTSWGTSSYGPRDDADFQCLCLHNSSLVQEMINDTINRFSHVTNNIRQSLLYLVGIRMHVLADTWAHEYFTGTPNYWVNDVTDIQIINEFGLDFSKSKSPAATSSYSVFYLGHGQVGHLPDIRLLKFSFRPHWLGKSYPAIEKDNISVFLSAFCQMADAMKAIRNGQQFVKQDYDAAAMAGSLNITNPELQNILQSCLTSIPVYQIGAKKTNPARLHMFQDMARIQRDLVIHFLGTNKIDI